MTGYDDPTPPSAFRIPPGYSSTEEALARIHQSGEPPDPLEKLTEVVIGGELAVIALARNGGTQEVRVKLWEKLGRDETRTILWRQDSSVVNFFGMNKPRLGSLSRDWRPLFRTSDLNKRLPTKMRSVDERMQLVEKSANNLGRPPNLNADDFWIEIGRCAHDGDLGRTQSDFIKQMVRWAKAKMKHPYSPHVIEKKVEKFWKALNLRNQ